jgi:GNAT superfamily N-acetyltransferase
MSLDIHGAVTMAEMEIRLMHQSETAAIRALMEQTFEIYLRPIFYIHPESTLVAVAGERILGGINLDIYHIRGDKLRMGYLGWLYIAEDARGLGIGKQLVAAGLEFLSAAGCTEVAACVEGDNPSSFKQLAFQGFAPLSLGGQLKRFRFGLFKVWKHASRFFDFGYFLWHKKLAVFPDEVVSVEKQKSAPMEPTRQEQGKNLITTGLFSLAMWAAVILRNHLIPFLANPTVPVQFRLLWLFFPLIVLGIRTLAMWLFARKYRLPVVFAAWDTANVLGFLFPIVTGWPFVVPGNWYRRGTDWQLVKDSRTLGILAFGTTLVEISLLMGTKIIIGLVLPATLWGMDTGSVTKILVRFLIILSIADTLLFFYPFCGFNASRIKRLSPWITVATGILLMAVLVFL